MYKGYYNVQPLHAADILNDTQRAKKLKECPSSFSKEAWSQQETKGQPQIIIISALQALE